MSCMEHYCTRCNWSAMDNKPGLPSDRCPKCKAPLVHHWDEELDRDPPERPEDPQEEGLECRIRGRRKRYR